MKFKHLAFVFAFTTGSFSMLNNVAYAEEAIASSASAEGAEEDLKMFRFALRMDKLEFIKSAMQLDEAQEQKFLQQYDRYDIELKALNDERLATIKEYAANFDKITDQEADILVKRSFDFRKKRTALL